MREKNWKQRERKEEEKNWRKREKKKIGERKRGKGLRKEFEMLRNQKLDSEESNGANESVSLFDSCSNFFPPFFHSSHFLLPSLSPIKERDIVSTKEKTVTI